MAAATTIILAAGLALSAGAATAQTVSANKDRKRAKQAMDNFETIEIENAYKNLAPSTAGEELQAETVARQSATMSEQASKSGARGVAFAGDIGEFETQNMRQISSYLDQRQKEYQTLLAQGEMQAQGLRLQQENAELAGIGNLYNVAQQNMASGINSLANTGISAAGMLGSNAPQATTNAQNQGVDLNPNVPIVDSNINNNDLNTNPEQFLT